MSSYGVQLIDIGLVFGILVFLFKKPHAIAHE